MIWDIRHILVLVFLALAVLVLWLCGIGIMRGGPFNRLHFLGTASIVGPILITLAIFLDGSSVQASVKAATLAAIIVITGPATGHAIARAIRIRREGMIKAEPPEIARGTRLK